MINFRNHILPIICIIVVIAIGVYVGYMQITPPSAPVDDATYDGFMAHIEAIASEPHLSGTDGIAGVRSYIISELDRMGVPYDRQPVIYTPEQAAEAYARVTSPQYYDAVYNGVSQILDDTGADALELENIVVTLDVTEGHSTDALFIVSHYDSVYTSYGAADDGVAVAAMLRTIASIKDEPRTNTIHFVFTDGEELGLLGAARFADLLNRSSEGTVFVNLEARGNAGGLVMFQTSPQNLNLIQQYAKGTHTPIAFSFASAVYATMPNNTDFTCFLDKGYNGLNFAVIDNGEAYHTPGDNYANLNRDSAAHYLYTVQSLVNYWSTADLSAIHGDSDAVYFPFIKGNLVVIPKIVAVIVGYAAAVIALLWLIFLIYCGRIGIMGILRRTVECLLTVAVCGSVAYAVTAVLNILEPPNGVYPTWAYNDLLIGVVIGLAIALSLLLAIRTYQRTHDALAAITGVMPLYILLTVACTIVLPEGCYLFALPLLMQVVCGVLCIVDASVVWRYAAYCVFGVAALLLLVPVIYLVHIALTAYVAWITAILCAMTFYPIFAMATMLFAQGEVDGDVRGLRQHKPHRSYDVRHWRVHGFV